VQYQLAFSYFVGKKPTGWTNLLLATVCILIPVVGVLVLLGYRAEVAERLARDPDLRRYPDFSFDRFMDLLTRGLWPFLINLLGAVVTVPLVFVVMFAVPLVAGRANDPAAALVVFGLLFGFFLLVTLALTAVLTPMMFHAELANRFDLGGALRFAASFLKLVGGRAVVTYVVFVILSVPVSLLGMLLCFVGVYPASVLLTMAGQHLMVQLYLEYLDRGGEEIVKTESDTGRRRRRDDDYDDEDESDTGRRRRRDDDYDDEDDDYDDRPRRR
jgi:hypothetical protein